MLWRGVETGVTYVNSSAQRHAKGLNGAVQVLVKERILIVPDSRGGVGHVVAHKPNAIVTRIGHELGNCCACSCPSLDCRLDSHRGTNRRKVENRRPAGDRELTIGEIIEHVTLSRMRLAPGVFKRGNVSSFAKIGGARILRRDQVTRIHQDPVRYGVMIVTGVVVRVRWESSSEGIDPCA